MSYRWEKNEKIGRRAENEMVGEIGKEPGTLKRLIARYFVLESGLLLDKCVLSGTLFNVQRECSLVFRLTFNCSEMVIT